MENKEKIAFAILIASAIMLLLGIFLFEDSLIVSYSAIIGGLSIGYLLMKSYLRNKS